MRKNIWPIRLGINRRTFSFLWVVCFMLEYASNLPVPHHILFTKLTSEAKWLSTNLLVTCVSRVINFQHGGQHGGNVGSVAMNRMHVFPFPALKFYIAGIYRSSPETLYSLTSLRTSLLTNWSKLTAWSLDLYTALVHRLQYESCCTSKNCFSTGKNTFSGKTYKWLG